MQNSGSNNGVNGRIVIGLDDLEPDVQKTYPGMNGSQAQSINYPGHVGANAKGTSTSLLGGSQIKLGIVAGIIGGFLAWGFGELFFESADKGQKIIFSLLIDMGLWFGVVGALIGMTLGASEGIASGSKEKALSGGTLGAVLGFIGGFVSGVVAQFIYSALRGGAQRGEMGQQVLARTIGWAIAGVGLGLAQGMPSKQKRKIINGLIGGLIGGALGGLAFDFIGSQSSSAVVSRFFGIVAMGGFTGGAIGMVEEARKEAWLRVVAGPLTGKQFILYGALTRIGRSPDCEITLVKDPDVWPEHARFIAAGNRYRIEANQGAPLMVNNRNVGSSELRGGNTIQIGTWTMVFEEKAVFSGVH